MWVSRKEWTELRAEVAELRRRHESHVVEVVGCRNFTVYEPAALKRAQEEQRASG